MKLISAIILAATAPAAWARYIQVNYYTDGGCSSYNTNPPNVPTDGSCYQYQYGGTNSANIANCDGYSTCLCLFYTGPECSGLSASTVYGSSNCASDWGTGFQSFRCYAS